MPTKKTTKKAKESGFGSFDLQKMVQSTDSYKSLIYGIVTVVVLFIVIALGIRTLQQNKAQIDEEALSTQRTTDERAGNQYTVVEGDTLWSIAEKEYNDGFKWTEIAKANNLTEASVIEEGKKLTIPEVKADSQKVAMNPTESVSPTAMTSPTVKISPTNTPAATLSPTKAMQGEQKMQVGSKISGKSYKIVEGDNLWDISIRAFGDGYRWVEIARLNNLSNPDLIFPGTTLNLPAR